MRERRSYSRKPLSAAPAAKGPITVNSRLAAPSSFIAPRAEGSSILRTKLVPVPPPPILEERIRELVQADKDFRKSLEPQPPQNQVTPPPR